ncbi:MAG: GIY-YIG nuclease family protein [Gammaproteobacteria bacterium]|nr:GIY-YIG nuclease family protein [Gammaproteobacteria bacterium]
MNKKVPYVYIMANKKNGTLYIGVTSDLIQRVWQHKNKLVEGFSEKYGTNRLVYFEQHQEIIEAISREKQIKKWRRQWKIELIESKNPQWDDLWSQIQ